MKSSGRDLEVPEKSLPELSDEELSRLSQEGNSEAEECLLERYKSYVRSLSRARFLAGGETDDLIQEGMIGLMKAARDYDPSKGASFRTFAALCIVRQQSTALTASNRLKNEPLNRSVSLSWEDGEMAFSQIENASPEEIVLGREASRELKAQIMEKLSPFEKKVLTLYLEGRNYREIAGILGRTPKTTDNALQRIRAKVRELFPEDEDRRRAGR